MKIFPLRIGSIGRLLPLSAAMSLLATPPALAQRPTSVVPPQHPVVFESKMVQGRTVSAQSTSAHKTAKGAGIGFLVGALSGVAVAAMIEAGNEGGLPEIREREKGLAYAVFVPTGAVLGAVVGAVIGARRH